MMRIDNYRLTEEKESEEIEKLKYTLRLLDKHILHMYEVSHYLSYYSKNDVVEGSEEHENAIIICKLLSSRIISCKEKETTLYNQIKDLRGKMKQDKIESIKELNYMTNYDLSKTLNDWHHKIELRHMNDINGLPVFNLDKLKTYLADYNQRALLDKSEVERLKRDIEMADKWILEQENKEIQERLKDPIDNIKKIISITNSRSSLSETREQLSNLITEVSNAHVNLVRKEVLGKV